MLGEMADALLFSSQRALPERLLSLGFSYKDPELPAALQRIVSEGV
jgi:NAD dependent epimerase/dehydratase family enzyme